jgi:hypothetical protein
LLINTRTLVPPIPVWMICRRVWLVSWTNGNGAKVCPGGGVATAGPGEGEHWFTMKGGTGGTGGSGNWGRPTSAVDHVPTQWSAARAGMPPWTINRPSSAATNTAKRQESCAKFDRRMTFSLRLEGKPMGNAKNETYSSVSERERLIRGEKSEPYGDVAFGHSRRLAPPCTTAKLRKRTPSPRRRRSSTAQPRGAAQHNGSLMELIASHVRPAERSENIQRMRSQSRIRQLPVPLLHPIRRNIVDPASKIAG